MKPRKPLRRHTPPLCAELHDDDGVDPREFFRVGETSRPTDRKTLQLCSQIRDALNYLLTGDSGDELLELFQVVDVCPAPNASQLLVTVQPVVRLAAPLDRGMLLDRLAYASGRLRAGVAAAITRKRAPKLLFQVTGVEWHQEDRP